MFQGQVRHSSFTHLQLVMQCFSSSVQSKCAKLLWNSETNTGSWAAHMQIEHSVTFHSEIHHAYSYVSKSQLLRFENSYRNIDFIYCAGLVIRKFGIVLTILHQSMPIFILMWNIVRIYVLMLYFSLILKLDTFNCNEKHRQMTTWQIAWHTLILKNMKTSMRGKSKYDPDNIKYRFTWSEDKRDLYRPQQVLCGDLLAAKSMKPLKKTFRNQTLKQTTWNYHNTLINI